MSFEVGDQAALRPLELPHVIIPATTTAEDHRAALASMTPTSSASARENLPSVNIHEMPQTPEQGVHHPHIEGEPTPITAEEAARIREDSQRAIEYDRKLAEQWTAEKDSCLPGLSDKIAAEIAMWPESSQTKLRLPPSCDSIRQGNESDWDLYYRLEFGSAR